MQTIIESRYFQLVRKSTSNDDVLFFFTFGNRYIAEIMHAGCKCFANYSVMTLEIRQILASSPPVHPKSVWKRATNVSKIICNASSSERQRENDYQYHTLICLCNQRALKCKEYIQLLIVFYCSIARPILLTK